MERIGNIKEKICENESIYYWSFGKITDFNKSYRSNRGYNFPYKLTNGCQIAFVPNVSQSAGNFFLFLYGYKGQGGPKMIYSACLKDPDDETFDVSWPEVCLNLKTSSKLFEIHLAHPILHNRNKYVFELKVKLTENAAITSSLTNSNICIEDSKEGKQAASATFEGIPTNMHCLTKLIQDMKFLYTSGDMWDTEIHIGDDIFHVHKLILCARSPVFKKMMEHDCLESASKSITITDYPTPQFIKFLKYLYTGEVESDTMETVMSLYSLGDKYDVALLKETCSNTLQSRLSSESVVEVADIICDVLQLAECHGDSELKDLAASFIVDNFPLVSNKQGWKDLMKNNPELISNILVLVASGLHKQVYKTVN